MGFVLDGVRDAIKAQKPEEGKEPIKITSYDEDKIRGFEAGLETLSGIVEKLDEADVNIERLREKMEEKLRNLTKSLKR